MYHRYIENAVESHIIDTLSLHDEDYAKAHVDVYGEKQSLEHIRNNRRLEFSDKELAKVIDKVIRSLDDFPLVLNEKVYIRPSDNFRSYLYEPGQYFKAHRDGSSKEHNEKSKITCLLYLNDTQGGETVLMPEGYADKKSHISISPQKGSILLFEHLFWHEGKPVNAGRKYVVRTDLMYST